MAIAMLMEFQGATEQQYDAVIADLNLGGKPYAGGVFHVAGPADGGMRIVDVWDSQAAFDSFFQQKLQSTLQKHNVQPPKVTVWPVRNYLK